MCIACSQNLFCKLCIIYLLLLRSLHYWSFLCCCYVHFIMISTTSNTPWLRKDIFYFSFQHYVHYILITTENTFTFIPTIGPYTISSVVLQDLYRIQYFHRQEFQWSLKCYFFPQEVRYFYKNRTCQNNFTVRNFSGVLNAWLPFKMVWKT